jgi:hypothetical protein
VLSLLSIEFQFGRCERGRISSAGAPQQRRDLKSTKSQRKKRRAKESRPAGSSHSVSIIGGGHNVRAAYTEGEIKSLMIPPL